MTTEEFQPQQRFHDRFNFFDGNIILQATGIIRQSALESPQEERSEDPGQMPASHSWLFRVHKGVLAVHTGAFRDMFSLPGSGADNDLIDGLPVVYMRDTANDVANLLTVMYYSE